MDQLAAQLDEQVLIQRGASSYLPRHAQHFSFTTSQEMVHLTQEARIVVAHAAAGTIILCLKNSKPLVLVPRLKQFGEHFDDHQLQLARALDAEGKAVSVFDPSLVSLQAAMAKAIGQKPFAMMTPTLVEPLRQILGQWDRENSRQGEETKKKL